MSTFIAAISSPAELKKLVMRTHRLLLKCVSSMDIEGQITFRCQPEEERSFETRIAMTRTSVSCLALLHWIAAHPVMLGAGCYLAVLHQHCTSCCMLCIRSTMRCASQLQLSRSAVQQPADRLPPSPLQDRILYRGVCVLPEKKDEVSDAVADLAFRGADEEGEEGEEGDGCNAGALVQHMADLTREYRASLQLPDGELDDANGDNTGMFLPEWGADFQ